MKKLHVSICIRRQGGGRGRDNYDVMSYLVMKHGHHLNQDLALKRELSLLYNAFFWINKNANIETCWAGPN